MNIGIIGGGSIGLLVGAKLSREHNVTIYVRRNDQKLSIIEQGISILHTFNNRNINVLLTDELKQEDCYIVCVKQAHVQNLIPSLNKITKPTPVIFLQNGMGHIDLVKQLRHPSYLGVIDHGALRINDYTVKHTGYGGIRISVYHGERGELNEIADKLNEADFPVRIAEDPMEMLSEKLIVNAVINPLTALFAVPNGDVIHNPYIRNIACELCQEAAFVLELDGEKQWDRVKHVANKTRENLSSMLKDVRDGRKTENDAISGYLINKAKQEIPYTTFVYNSIRALEMKKGINE